MRPRVVGKAQRWIGSTCRSPKVKPSRASSARRVEVARRALVVAVDRAGQAVPGQQMVAPVETAEPPIRQGQQIALEVAEVAGRRPSSSRAYSTLSWPLAAVHHPTCSAPPATILAGQRVLHHRTTLASGEVHPPRVRALDALLVRREAMVEWVARQAALVAWARTARTRPSALPLVATAVVEVEAVPSLVVAAVVARPVCSIEMAARVVPESPRGMLFPTTSAVRT